MPEPLDPEGFTAEAERLAAHLGVAVEPGAVGAVQRWLAEHRTDADAVAAGCFVGDAIRRAAGGTWRSDGTLSGVGQVAETSPLAKARAGEDLVTYVADVLRYAR